MGTTSVSEVVGATGEVLFTGRELGERARSVDGVALPTTTSPEMTFELVTSAIPTLRQFLTVCANKRE